MPTHSVVTENHREMDASVAVSSCRFQIAKFDDGRQTSSNVLCMFTHPVHKGQLSEDKVKKRKSFLKKEMTSSIFSLMAGVIYKLETASSESPVIRTMV